MYAFTTFDRCDRCGATAHHRATKAGIESELLLCDHHNREHRDELLNQYWLIESDYLQYESTPAQELENRI